jgi:hypothetical protein
MKVEANRNAFTKIIRIGITECHFGAKPSLQSGGLYSLAGEGVGGADSDEGTDTYSRYSIIHLRSTKIRGILYDSLWFLSSFLNLLECQRENRHLPSHPDASPPVPPYQKSD